MIYIFSSIFFSLLLQWGMVWKCKIRKKEGLMSGIGIGLFSGFLIAMLHFFFPFISVISLLAISFCTVIGFTLIWTLLRFYRDPERKIPNQPGVIVSPADGRIRYMVKVNKGEIGFSIKGEKHILLSDVLASTYLNSQNLMLIGIEMNLLDVHVNRAPISGKIVYSKHVPGKFLSLRGFDFLTQNERMFTVIQNEKMQVGMVQIASHLVRRIVCYRKIGDFVQCGDRIGMIRFGSQVDVLIPTDKGIHFLVKPGDYVKAGESILARYFVP